MRLRRCDLAYPPPRRRLSRDRRGRHPHTRRRSTPAPPAALSARPRGRTAGGDRDALTAAQAGTATDPRVEALLRFALALVDERGHVTAQDVQAVRDAGWTDEQVVEVVAHVALNLFTNYVNVALDVPVDFPAVGLRRAA